MTSFLCSLEFLLFHVIEHIKRCLQKIKIKFCGSVFVIWLYLQKPMYRPCDLDLWHMKVNYFVWIDYKPISVLYKFQSDISTNSREIKYQNIEKSPSLIIERFVSMATKKLTGLILKKKFCQCSQTWIHRLSGNQDDRISIVACTSFKYRNTNRQTDGQTAVTNILYEKSFRLSQSNNCVFWYKWASWTLMKPLYTTVIKHRRWIIHCPACVCSVL